MGSGTGKYSGGPRFEAISSYWSGHFCSPNFLGKDALSKLLGRNAWWVRVRDCFYKFCQLTRIIYVAVSAINSTPL